MISRMPRNEWREILAPVEMNLVNAIHTNGIPKGEEQCNIIRFSLADARNQLKSIIVHSFTIKIMQRRNAHSSFEVQNFVQEEKTFLITVPLLWSSTSQSMQQLDSKPS
jgi:hypothetical protein